MENLNFYLLFDLLVLGDIEAVIPLPSPPI